MHTIDLIRQTLDALFVQYRAFNKNTFVLSVNVLLIVFLTVVVVALPILLLVGFLRLGGGHMPLLEQLYYPETLYSIRIRNFSYAISLFGMAIFGYYLLRPNSENTPPKSTRDVFENVPSKHWSLLVLLLGGIILFYTITFLYLFDFQSENDGWLSAWEIAPLEYFSFLQWLDAFFELLKNYLPIPPVFVFLIALYEGKVQAEGFKKYASAMLASFLLIFAFDAVWGSIHSLFRTYLMGLVSLPFRELLLPSLFGVIGEIALGAYFAVANAIVLVYPFYWVHRQSQPQTMAAVEAE